MKSWLTALLACAALLGASARAQSQAALKLDFGSGVVAAGYTGFTTGAYSSATGYGWASAPGLQVRDRAKPDDLRRDFVFGTSTAVFRIAVPAGTYRLRLTMGDMDYGNHVLSPSLNVSGVALPTLTANAASFAVLSVAFTVAGPTLEITCASPENNWVLNALTLEPADAPETPTVTHEDFTGHQPSTWQDISSWPDPIAPLVAAYRQNLATAPPFRPTGLTRQDYLTVIAGNVDYFKQHQNASGAIIDPYKNIEWQYSTPAFAQAAATLVEHAGRTDLLEPAAKAMDWAVTSLANHAAPQHHEDFFAPMLAHALPILKRHVAPERAAGWEDQIRGFNPYTTYSAGVGGGNWNVVALAGDYLFHQLGLRANLHFTEDSLAAQGKSFTSPWGLYLEGPMPYDHFPRLWVADMVAQGYEGRLASELKEVLRRGALTSMFMQSPNGELPAGGRSAHHQWNEAEQCVTYEVYAARAMQDGDPQLAAAFKRAAHLALGSMKRWVRPSGEMNIVKNYFDPALRFGYEGYSAHSQYNLLPMAMLAIAFEHAETTEALAEIPAPADVGGFVFQIDPRLHKVFANAGGMYVEIETNADPRYNATGLLRIHRAGADPQLGPSDALTASSSYSTPAAAKTNAAVGIAWKDANGQWKRLADYNGKAISSASVSNVSQAPHRVAFRLTYNGVFDGPTSIIEDYVITPDAVELTTTLPNYSGPALYVWPILTNNGAEDTNISVRFGAVTVALNDARQTFTPVGATTVRVEDTRYAGRNGWFRLGVAEYPAAPATLRIAPVVPYDLTDVKNALQAWAGLRPASPADIGRLNALEPTTPALDLRDALEIAGRVLAREASTGDEHAF